RQVGARPAELVGDGRGERLARRILAVVEEDPLRRRRQGAAPAQQLVAVGVGREAVELVDARLHPYRLAVDGDRLGAVDQAAAAGARRLIADEDDRAPRSPSRWS